MSSLNPKTATLTRPWAISAEGMDMLVGALQSRDGKPLQNARTVNVVNGVATIPVSGPLTKSANWVSEFFGASTYEGIARDFLAALESSDVRAIVFDIDSPGGEVSGCGELSKLIFDARGKKPITSYASGQMCSAAYWIGSAADKVIADPSAMLGSIGVRCSLVDASGMLEQVGIKVYDLQSEQSPNKVVDPSSEADRERVRATLTAMASVFIEDVARNCGASAAAVQSNFGRGDVMIGKSAVACGLAHAIGDMDSLTRPAASTTVPSVTAKNVAKGNRKMNAKCNNCQHDIAEGAEAFCGGCVIGAASGLDAQVFALTGKDNAAEAIGVLNAWKASAGEAQALQERVREQEKAAEALAFDAEIATAKNQRLLAMSDEHKRNKAALAFKGQAESIKGLKSFLAALDPITGPAAHEAPAEKPADQAPVGNGAVHGFSAEQVRIMNKIGVDPSKAASHKTALFAHLQNSEEK